MEKEQFILLAKQGMDLYSRLLNDNPKDRDKYEPNLNAWRNTYLELTTTKEKEMKNGKRDLSI